MIKNKETKTNKQKYPSNERIKKIKEVNKKTASKIKKKQTIEKKRNKQKYLSNEQIKKKSSKEANKPQVR